MIPADYRPDLELIKTLPYGLWSTPEREYLFSRGYSALMIRAIFADGSRGPGMGITGSKHISSMEDVSWKEEYFRDDGQFNPRHPEMSFYFVTRLQGLIVDFEEGRDVRKYLLR